jgi:tape measure domain-containing protein
MAAQHSEQGLAALGQRGAQSFDAVTRAGSAMSNVLQGALGFSIATTATSFFQQVGAGAQEMVQFTSQLEAQKTSLNAVTGSATQGAAEYAFLTQSADKLSVSLGALVPSYTGFIAATKGTVLEGDKARSTFEKLTAGMRVLGLSSEQVQGTFLAFQQILSKGTVQAEEMNQINERFPGALNVAARAFDTTTAALRKMLEQGQIVSTEFVEKFGNQVEKELGSKVSDAAKTVGSAMARMGNDIRAIKTAVAESGLIQWLVDISEKSVKAAADLAGVGRAQREANAKMQMEAPNLPKEEITRLAKQPLDRSTALSRIQELEAINKREIGKSPFWSGEIDPQRREERVKEIRKLRAQITETERLQFLALEGIDMSSGERFQETTGSREERNFNQAISGRIAALNKDLDANAFRAQKGQPGFDQAKEDVKDYTKALADLNTEMLKNPALVAKMSADNTAAIEKLKSEAAAYETDPFAVRKDPAALRKFLTDAEADINRTTQAMSSWATQTEIQEMRLQKLDALLKKLPASAMQAGGAFPSPAPPLIAEAIQRIAPQHNLDPRLVTAIVQQESNFQPGIHGPVTRSGERAAGLMQLMPDTAREVGVTDRLDVEQNLQGGMAYFRKLLDMFGNDVRLALAAYNAGPGAVQRYGGIPPYAQTQAYVPKIMNTYEALKAQSTVSPGIPQDRETSQILQRLMQERTSLLEGKEGSAADVLAQSTIENRGKAMEQLITSLQSGGKAMDEYEAAQVREKTAAIQGLATSEERVDAFGKLIDSLKNGRRSMSEYETAQVREKLATVDGFEASKARITTLLEQADTHRTVIAELEKQKDSEEKLNEAEKPALELLKQMQDQIERLTLSEDEYWEKRIRSMKISKKLQDEIIATRKDLDTAESKVATPYEAREAVSRLREKPENFIGRLDDGGQLNDYQRAFQDLGDQIVNTFQRGTDAIAEFAQTGHFSLKRFLSDIHGDFMRWALQGLIMKPLQSALEQGAEGKNWEQSKKLMVSPLEKAFGWLWGADKQAEAPKSPTQKEIREYRQGAAQKISEQEGWKTIPPYRIPAPGVPPAQTANAPLSASPVGSDTQAIATTSLQSSTLFSQSVQTFATAVASMTGTPPPVAPEGLPGAPPDIGSQPANRSSFAEIATRLDTTGDATSPQQPQAANAAQATTDNAFAQSVYAFGTAASNFATGTQTFAQASTSFASSLIQWAAGQATKEGGWIDTVMGLLGGASKIGGGSGNGGFNPTGASEGAAGFAEGGYPPVNRPVWVGEKGPELFIPRTTGRIMSHAESIRMTSFADGGIMTAHGRVPLRESVDDVLGHRIPVRRYSWGGIAYGPQAALFGEGSTPEAYVPVPSGKIPVEMRGGDIQGGTTVVFNVSTPDVTGFRSSQRQIMAKAHQALGRQ